MLFTSSSFAVIILFFIVIIFFSSPSLLLMISAQALAPGTITEDLFCGESLVNVNNPLLNIYVKWNWRNLSLAPVLSSANPTMADLTCRITIRNCNLLRVVGVPTSDIHLWPVFVNITESSISGILHLSFTEEISQQAQVTLQALGVNKSPVKVYISNTRLFNGGIRVSESMSVQDRYRKTGRNFTEIVFRNIFVDRPSAKAQLTGPAADFFAQDGVGLGPLSTIGSVLFENVTVRSRYDGLLINMCGDIHGVINVTNCNFTSSFSDGTQVSQPFYIWRCGNIFQSIIISNSYIRLSDQNSFENARNPFRIGDVAFLGSLTVKNSTFIADKLPITDSWLRYAIYIDDLKKFGTLLLIEGCTIFLKAKNAAAINFQNLTGTFIEDPAYRDGRNYFSSIIVRNNNITVNATHSESLIANAILLGSSDVGAEAIDSFDTIEIVGNSFYQWLAPTFYVKPSISNLKSAAARNSAITVIAIQWLRLLNVHHNYFYLDMMKESIVSNCFKSPLALTFDLAYVAEKFRNVSFSNNNLKILGIGNVMNGFNFVPAGLKDMNEDYFEALILENNTVDMSELRMMTQTLTSEDPSMEALLPQSMLTPAQTCFGIAVTAKFMSIRNNDCIIRETAVLLGDVHRTKGGVFASGFMSLSDALPVAHLETLLILNNSLRVVPFAPTWTERHTLIQKYRSSPTYDLQIKNGIEIGGFVAFVNLGPFAMAQTFFKATTLRVDNNKVNCQSTGGAGFGGFGLLMFQRALIPTPSSSPSSSSSSSSSPNVVWSVSNNTQILEYLQSKTVADLYKLKPPKFVTIMTFSSVYVFFSGQTQSTGIFGPTLGAAAALVGFHTIETGATSASSFTILVENNHEIFRQVFENSAEEQQVRDSLSASTYHLTCGIYNATSNFTYNKKLTIGKYVVARNNILDASDSPCRFSNAFVSNIVGDTSSSVQNNQFLIVTAQNNTIIPSATVPSSFASSFVAVNVDQTVSSSSKLKIDINMFGNKLISPATSTSTSRNLIPVMSPLIASPPSVYGSIIVSVNISRESTSSSCNSIRSSVVSKENLLPPTDATIDLKNLPFQMDDRGCRYKTPSSSRSTSQTETEQEFVPQLLSVSAATISSINAASSATAATTVILALGSAANPSLSFTVSRQQAMMNYARSAMDGDCRGLFPAVTSSVVRKNANGDQGHVEEAPQIAPAESPTQLAIGSSKAKYYIGSVIGNVGFALLLVLFGQLVGHLARRYIAKDLKNWNNPLHVFAHSHLSLILFFLCAILVSPTFSNALLVLVATTSEEVSIPLKVIALVFALIFVVISVFFVVWCTFIRKPIREQYRITFDMQKATTANANRHPILAGFFWLFRPEGMWRLPSNKVTPKEEQDYLIAEPSFETYHTAKWFVVVEMAVGLLVALPAVFAQFASDGKSSCIIQGSLLLVIFTVYLALLLWKRPQKIRFMRVFVPLLTIQQWVCVLVTFVAVVRLDSSQPSITNQQQQQKQMLPEWIFSVLLLPVSMEAVMSVFSILAAISPILILLKKFFSRVFAAEATVKKNENEKTGQKQDDEKGRRRDHNKNKNERERRKFSPYDYGHRSSSRARRNSETSRREEDDHYHQRRRSSESHQHYSTRDHRRRESSSNSLRDLLGSPVASESHRSLLSYKNSRQTRDSFIPDKRHSLSSFTSQNERKSFDDSARSKKTCASSAFHVQL